MNTITLINEKGGVGKTSQAIHIAAGLAILGYTTLLIDTDPQANATLNFSVPAKDCMYRLLVQEEEWRNLLVEIYPEQYAGVMNNKGRLLLMPSHIGNRAIPLVTDDIDQLAERLDELIGYVDFVIIDTSPTPSLMHSMFYRASDYVLIPTQYEDFSLAGLIHTNERVKKESAYRNSQGLPPIRLMGIQPNHYRGTNAHADGSAQLTKHFGGLVWHPLGLRTAWTEAVKNRQTLYAHAPQSTAAEEAWIMVHNVHKTIERSKLNV